MVTSMHIQVISRMMKKIAIGILVILSVVVVGLTIDHNLRVNSLLEIDANTRAEFPGEFVSLPDGDVSYYARGPEQGRVVVLVHGFSTPKSAFNNNVEQLITAGYRVIAYDHYGRGYSDRPDIAYDTNLYTRELRNLLDALEVTEPVTLVGYSMGGANVIGYAAKYPQSVKELVLIAPGGLESNPGWRTILSVPGLGEWMADRFLMPSVQPDVETLTELDRAFFANYTDQFLYKGYSSALLSTLRNDVVFERWDDYRAVGEAGIPISAIWGTDDETVPFSGSEKLLELIPLTELFPIEGGRHSIVITKAAVVNELLLKILARSQIEEMGSE